MEIKNDETNHYRFHLLCVICTISMISYCVYKFVLDDDMTSIVFRRFNGKGNEIYPTLTLCFKGASIFDAEKIQRVSQSNIDYQKFLSGLVWDQRLYDINYDNVTLDFENLVKYIRLQASNGYNYVPIYTWKNGNQNTKSNFPFQISYRSPTEKCFSFDINTFNVPKLSVLDLARIELKLSNYSNTYESSVTPRLLLAHIFLSYPHQLMRSFPIIKIGKIDRQRKNYMIKILTQGIEIIERRPKRKDSCKHVWWNDDNQIIEQMASNIGCSLKHWGTNLNVPFCKSKEDYFSSRVPPIAVVDAMFLEKYVPPCREIQTIMSSNTITEDNPGITQSIKEPYTIFKIQFKSTMYKMIRNVRAFNEESLVGNLGGYVGLFLGVAFWQAPVFAAQLITKFRNFKRTFKL